LLPIRRFFRPDFILEAFPPLYSHFILFSPRLSLNFFLFCAICVGRVSCRMFFCLPPRRPSLKLSLTRFLVWWKHTSSSRRESSRTSRLLLPPFFFPPAPSEILEAITAVVLSQLLFYHPLQFSRSGKGRPFFFFSLVQVITNALLFESVASFIILRRHPLFLFS